MESCELDKKSCVPCRGGVPALSHTEIEQLLPNVPRWAVKEVEGVSRIERTFEFEDFVMAMKFVNAVAGIAEAEGHHPDLHIHWNQVRVEVWTHKIGGLHENDFILASKIDRVSP